MVKTCAVPNCKRKWDSEDETSFYRFPKKEERREKWVRAIFGANNPQENLDSKWVCGQHFISGKKNKNNDHPDFVPTIFSKDDCSTDPNNMFPTSSQMQKVERYERVTKRKSNDRVDDSTDVVELNSENVCTEEPTAKSTESTLYDKIRELEEKNKKLEERNKLLEKRNEELQKELLYYKYDEHFFCNDDEKVQFHTGLPDYKVLKSVFDLVSPYVETKSNAKLSKFQQFISVLMRLRLGLLEQDVAYRFQLHQSNVSRIFHKWIVAMKTRLNFLIVWPERDQLRKTLPACFIETFKSCVVIIDCFEVFIEKPSDLTARAVTFSNYKHHNTLKILIGITPQGTISFISEPWGGRTSDIFLTENCGLLNKLLTDDVVLADRGFNIQESASLYCAKVVIPPFTKNKPQLSKMEVDSTRHIARVRIHVERVIGLLRNKYTILQKTLPISILINSSDGECQFENILIVCSALCNLCPSVIPKD